MNTFENSIIEYSSVSKWSNFRVGSKVGPEREGLTGSGSGIKKTTDLNLHAQQFLCLPISKKPVKIYSLEAAAFFCWCLVDFHFFNWVRLQKSTFRQLLSMSIAKLTADKVKCKNEWTVWENCMGDSQKIRYNTMCGIGEGGGGVWGLGHLWKQSIFAEASGELLPFYQIHHHTCFLYEYIYSNKVKSAESKFFKE